MKSVRILIFGLILSGLLLKSNEERAEMLMKEAQKEVNNRWSLYKQMSEMDYSLGEEAA